MKKRVLVVGGAGYIGGALTDILKENEVDFVVYDSLVYEDYYLKDVPLIKADIRDRAKLAGMMAEYDTVVWLAGLVGDGACAVNPEETTELNEEIPIWFAKNFHGHFIFTSTCSVYGANTERNLTITSPVNPLSLYAGTKLNVEKAIINRPNTTIFRLGTVHGIGDRFSRIRLDLVVNILTLKATMGEPLTVFGGNQWRPIIHVKDVAGAIHKAIDMGANDLNNLHNLKDVNIKIMELAKTIQQQIPFTNITYKDMPFEDLRNYHVKNSDFPYITKHSLKDSIKEMYQFFKDGRIKDPMNPVFHNQKYITWKNQK